MLSQALLALSVLGLSSAAPALRRQAPAYPTPSSSTGFTLVVNVTDSSLDFTPSINNYIFSTAHDGAGENFATIAPPTSGGPIFYQNGTIEKYAPYTTVTDGGEPATPYSISVQSETEFDYTYPTEHDVYVNVGVGTEGVGISHFPTPVYYLSPAQQGTWVVCKNYVPYYGKELFTVEFAYTTYTTVDGVFTTNKNLPAGCAPVNFVSQCATLPTLPAGSYSTHEFANTVGCYDDVSSIVWTADNGGY